jgi:hypothetical protein
MAEVFGIVASGISIASLAIQILENINRVIDFCQSIKDAPTEICRILLELQLLSNIVSGIQLVFEKRSLPEISEATIKNTLNLVRHDISRLSDLSLDLERKLNSKMRITRTWARVQTVLSEKKIAILRDHLDRAMGTLQLLQCWNILLVYFSLCMIQMLIELYNQGRCSGSYFTIYSNTESPRVSLGDRAGRRIR